ncbi:MAG TPA: polyprenyl synthetase family protein [Actinoplanes sp.]|nr:polyprenyl synthetase family protein [Actinoplanes sp.]
MANDTLADTARSAIAGTGRSAAGGTARGTVAGTARSALADSVPGAGESRDLPQQPSPVADPTALTATAGERNPADVAAGVVAAVDATLTDFLADQVAALDGVDPELGGFARITRDLVLAGGKRLRPTFAYWGWHGVHDAHQDPAALLPALASLELMHTFALVHDDVMDGSATRRGRPTAHRIFAAQHAAAARRGAPAEFGTAAAVLVGDLCLVWADQLLGRTPLPAEVLRTVRSCYDRMRAEAIAGQFLDLLGDAESGRWSVERALLVARYKTASYTVQRPLQFGAALAGGLGRIGTDAHLAAIDAYQRYGAAVGEAFQLRDDILGVYGDPLVTGKPTGDDLRTGKPTVLMMLARQLATPAQLAELDRGATGPRTPDHPDAGPTDALEIERLADIIGQTGAVSRVEAMIGQRVTEAVAALAAAPVHQQARDALTHLAVAATRRPA